MCQTWAETSKTGFLASRFMCQYPRIQPVHFLKEVTSPAIVGLNAFLNSFNLPINGLGGLLRKFFWQIGLLTPYSEVSWENKYSIQSRLLHHLLVIMLQKVASQN